MADENTPQDPAAEQPEQQTPAPETGAETPEPETGEAKDSKTVPLADLIRERKERQKLAKEIEALRASSMSDAEKAVAEAEKRGAQQASERYAARLVDEAFRAATVGRVLNPDALLSFDRKTFITDDGDVDREALTAWVEQHAAPVGPRRPSGDADQGARPVVNDPGPGLARLRAAYASSSKSA